MENLLNKEIEKLCKKNKVVGANIALYNNEEILYKYNYGYINKESDLKSTNDSLYKIGSNTKVLTALGIFKLIENNTISLDDDIKKYIPEFEVNSYFEYDKITIENLLMHRSGLISDLYSFMFNTSGDYHDIVGALKDTYLTSPPGQMFSYSNMGYTLLGIILERVSGLTYAEYIQKVIADPLGIRILFGPINEPNMSLNYNSKGEAVEDMAPTLIPAGAMTYMSTTDFVKIGQIFLNKENTIFKKEILELMETLNVEESIDKELSNVGYGLFHNSYNFGETVGKVLGHGGDTICHHSTFDYIPGLNIGVIVCTNSEQAGGLAHTLSLNVLTGYLKKNGHLGRDLSLDYRYSQTSCDEYVGKYATLAGLINIQKNKKNELVTKISNNPVKLVPCEDGFLQCYPNKWLLQLPPFKKAIKSIRIKLIKYFGNEVLVFEQTSKNHKNMSLIGCRYSETTIPWSIQDACGNYEVADEKLSELKCKCSLTTENGMLKFEIGAFQIKITNYLKVVNDNIAYTQGYGRMSREVLQIKKDNGEIYLIYSGVTFQKSKGDNS